MNTLALFKDNKDVDSTITLGGIVLSFVGLVVACVVMIFRGLDLPQALVDMFQHSKELMLLVAGYFFRKGQEALQNGTKGEDQK